MIKMEDIYPENSDPIPSIQLGKCFDGMSLNEDNQLALISSNLTGKFWHGAVGVFEDPKLAPNLPHVDYITTNEGGCVDLTWIDKERIAVATDAGTIDVWKMKEAPTLEKTILLAEHSDICSCIDISSVSHQLVSGSYDNTLKLWDLAVDLSIHTMTLHLDRILDVSWCKNSDHVFASASEDGSVRMYDIRIKERPCRTLHYSSRSLPTCLDWIDENKVCVGFSDGAVGILNLQTPGVLENSMVAHKKAVNKVLHLKSGVVASASNDFSVKVQDLEHDATMYSNSNHSEYVQDLVFWQGEENILLSCAYDGCVISHNIDNVIKDIQ